MPYKNNARKSNSRKTKFSNDKWLMMQFGKQYLDEKDDCFKSRIVISEENNEWSWCIREGKEVTHWFGVDKGRDLLARAIVANQAINTSFFESDKGITGNARINIKGVATEKELAAAKRAAENEAWLDEEEEEEEEDEDEEEEEVEEPVRTPKRKQQRPMETARKGKKQQSAREYPDLEEADLDDESSESEDYDEIPY